MYGMILGRGSEVPERVRVEGFRGTIKVVRDFLSLPKLSIHEDIH
jgi:hypothetical protein